MLGFLGRLFGAPEAVSGIVDGVTRGLDALVYTDEEKAADAAKERQRARAMIVDWMQATQGQNLARRLIALAITFIWLSMYLLNVLANIIAVWWDAGAEKLQETGNVAFDAAADMNPAVMLILAFYFAAPHMGDIATAAIGRFRSNVDGQQPPNRSG